MAIWRKRNGSGDELGMLVLLALLGGAAYVIYKQVPAVSGLFGGSSNSAGASTAGSTASSGPTSGTTFFTLLVPGTPFTYGDLYGRGWTTAQIQQLMQQDQTAIAGG